MTQCNGMNCGTTTGDHSPECRAEHAAAVAGGRFVKDGAPAFAADAAWDAYLDEQKRILGMPGLMARPSFLAGYRAASGQKLTRQQLLVLWDQSTDEVDGNNFGDTVEAFAVALQDALAASEPKKD